MFKKVSLRDKYDLSCNKVFVTGTQSLVRMCLLQSALDRSRGIATSGYITGYRGSPLGAIDQQFQKAEKQLADSQIFFQPALNEDLAATAIWGSQQAEMLGEGKKDGVFAIWYGKGPGVDRSGDAFRHANMSGTSKFGGVIALVGDDHQAESSTSCHQSEFALMDAMIPVLNPSNLQELVNFGLHGWALSRYSGLWCGIKCVKDNIESTASVNLAKTNFKSIIPNDFKKPDGGLNIRPNDNRFDQEKRLLRYKLLAAKAYVRKNNIDRVIFENKKAKFGIIATGKGYMDVLQALTDLGINSKNYKKFGLKLYKIGMSWPLEPVGIKNFVKNLSKVLIIEEKRSLIETQIKEILYNDKNSPSIIGKKDLHGKPLLPEDGTINSMDVASVIGNELIKNEFISNKILNENYRKIKINIEKKIKPLSIERTPYFCAGCPHNSSTKLPEGSRGYAGIGCHWLVQSMERSTQGFTHMGGEGANWIGESNFSNRKHIFQNIGDGTFNHSGLMAVRAAIASNVNITFKILYNDAVALTGGQKLEGDMTSIEIANLLSSLGVKRLIFVTEDLKRHNRSLFPKETEFFERSALQKVQIELSKVNGVTIIIYDQTCATEKRRKRKRGILEEPDEKIYINHEVCEGCGDCGKQSNCVAILPLETELGRKRKIDQSSCNKDFSCVNGLCPSFVTIKGGRLKKPNLVNFKKKDLKNPKYFFSKQKVINLVLTGVGGTGVITLGALIGMAAHIENKGCGIIDMAGLAQKGGAVTSHIRIADSSEKIQAIRIGPGGADVLISCDNLASATSDILKLINNDGHVISNENEMFPGDFTRNVDFSFPTFEIQKRLKSSVNKSNFTSLNSTYLANTFLGDSISSNLILLGVVWQLGLLPLRKESIEEAISLNGIAIEQSKMAFEFGRLWIEENDYVKNLIESKNSVQQKSNFKNTDQVIEDRFQRLINYHSLKYALQFKEFVKNIEKFDFKEQKTFTEIVARNLFKLMAIKDEYEIARLYTSKSFFKDLESQFEGDYKINFHFSPPLFSKIDKNTGRPKKFVFNQLFLIFLNFLTKIKRIRGTFFDVFSFTKERKFEKNILEQYKSVINKICKKINLNNYDIALQIANLPEEIRGFGQIKEKNYFHTKKKEESLLIEFKNKIKEKTLKRA